MYICIIYIHIYALTCTYVHLCTCVGIYQHIYIQVYAYVCRCEACLGMLCKRIASAGVWDPIVCPQSVCWRRAATRNGAHQKTTEHSPVGVGEPVGLVLAAATPTLLRSTPTLPTYRHYRRVRPRFRKRARWSRLCIALWHCNRMCAQRHPGRHKGSRCMCLTATGRERVHARRICHQGKGPQRARNMHFCNENGRGSPLPPNLSLWRTFGTVVVENQCH